ncbi:MAG: alpha/beta hydrolase, partial [Pseudomonas sp.]
MKAISKVLTGTLLALTMGSAFAEGDSNVEHRVQSFLDALNSGGGKPVEQLSPINARAVLTDAQAGVKLTLPKADVSQKTITVDGQSISLTIVRPAGVKG